MLNFSVVCVATSKTAGKLNFMMQTVEAVVDEKGRIHLLETVELKSVRRALVTLLPAQAQTDAPKDSVQGLGEVLDDDLESASREISAMFRNALEKSAKELAS
jgi:hypothetical protein